MGVPLPDVLIEGIAELEPIGASAVKALIDHFRKQQNLPPVDWTTLDAKFAADLKSSQAAQAQAPPKS
jgi:hypothetical protein